MGLLPVAPLAVVMFLYTLRGAAITPNLSFVYSAVSKGAVCLDGSPAYQLDFGENEGAKNWLVHMEGGGWCASDKECKQRSTDPIGSGSSTKKKKIEFTGILTNIPKFNPYFYNWNRVYVRYCDGSSFTGDKQQPVNGTYYRGAKKSYAIIEDLLNMGMNNASSALLSGCSAGGLAAILHFDRFGILLPPTANVKCLSDAGFFLTNASNTDILGDTFVQVVETHCFCPEKIVPDTRTPIFLLNSVYDIFQVARINFGNRVCKYELRGDCPADQQDKWKNYRFEYLQALTKLGNSSTRGLFINSCHTHCQSEFQPKWLGDPSSMLDNKTVADAVGEWFLDRRPLIQIVDYVHESPQQCVVDYNEPYVCNNYTYSNSYLCNNSLT